MNVLTGVDMSEITNKELARHIIDVCTMSHDDLEEGLPVHELRIAAERLAAMPDEDAIGNLLQERLGFRCLDSCIQKAECWVAVCNLLDYLKPNWRMIPAPTRKDSALIAIAQLAQQPTPDKAKAKEIFNKYHNERYNPASEEYRFEHFWDDLSQLFGSPDRETIKRYIYEYYYYRNHEHLEYLGPEAVGEEFDRWWDDEGKFLLGNAQQQSAEGVE